MTEWHDNFNFQLNLCTKKKIENTSVSKRWMQLERFSDIRRDCDILTWLYLANVDWEVNGVTLMSSEAKCLSIFARLETKRNNTHSYQIATVDSLKALLYYSSYSLQK